MNAATELRLDLPQCQLAALDWARPAAADAAAPTVLAVHGWLDNAASFERLAPLLARRHRVVALDLPGHGGSDHLPAGCDYHWSGYVAAVIGAADVLGLERFILLGHSLGAGVCSLVAAAVPARVEQLWLIEGLGLLGDDGSSTLRRFQAAMQTDVGTSRPRRVFGSVEQAVRARTLASGLPENQARPIIERALARATPKQDAGWRWRSDPRLTRSTPLRIAEIQIHELLRGIAAPTSLLLARPATPYLPGEPMARRAACVADIRVAHMSGGHHLHLEHPERVAGWFDPGGSGHAAGP